jgi:hypothetical protein
MYTGTAEDKTEGEKLACKLGAVEKERIQTPSVAAAMAVPKTAFLTR